jgi:hypothetical protein
VLGRAGRSDSDPQPSEVTDGPHGAGHATGREDRDGRSRGEAEDQPCALAAFTRPEAKQRFERGGDHVDLSLGERLRGADLGSCRAKGDGQAFPREVTLGLRHPQR